MSAPYVLSNPQIADGNGIAELDTSSDAAFDTGTIDPNAKQVGFINNGDGSGGGSNALVGVQGNLITLPAGASKTYPAVPGPGGTYKQTIGWNANGNQLLITAIF